MDSKNDSIDYTPLVSKLAKSLLSSNDKDVDSKEMLAHNREFISMVCNSLDMAADAYSSAKTFKIILQYIVSDKRLPRILYSEISSNIFSVDEQTLSRIVQNIDQLKDDVLHDYILEKGDPQYSTRKFVVYQNDKNNKEATEIFLKIFDHMHLVLYQIEKIKKETVDQTRELKKKYSVVNKKLDKSQNEYVTILGIFAAIILAVVGGLSYSREAINAVTIATVELPRLIVITAVVGSVLVSIIHMLVSFIFGINDKKFDCWSLWECICLIILISVLALLLSVGFNF